MLKYKNKVKIITGFYAGQIGIVIDDTVYGYVVKLEDGKEIHICSTCLKVIKGKENV